MFQELGWERHVAKLSASRLINSNCHWLPAESAALRRFCYSFLKEPVGQEELVEASASVSVSMLLLLSICRLVSFKLSNRIVWGPLTRLLAAYAVKRVRWKRPMAGNQTWPSSCCIGCQVHMRLCRWWKPEPCTLWTGHVPKYNDGTFH